MTINLPSIVQPFPEASPFLSIREFLVNGWTATSAQTFAIRPDGNALDLMLRVRSDNVTSANIALGIPITPPYTVTFPVYFAGELKWMLFTLEGRLAITGGIPPAGEISGIVRMPRKP